MNYSFIAADSKTAAKFSEAVYQELGNEKFWDFHHLLFANQTTVPNFTDEFFEAIVAEVASPEETEKVLLAYQNGEGTAAWDKDMKTANSLGVSSTPTILIDGKEFKGRILNDFTEMVEEAAASGE